MHGLSTRRLTSQLLPSPLMDTSPTHAGEEVGPGSTGDDAKPHSYGGAIFSGSQQFTVAGGTFTNITKNYAAAAAVLPHFRTIPLGDLDLQREIHLDRCSGVASLRRLHSAKIDRGRLDVTVAVYQGESAETEWRRDIATYMAVRHVPPHRVISEWSLNYTPSHPNIVQLYGTTICGTTYAAVFHDDLIPLPQFFDLYRHSHFSRVYLLAYLDIEFEIAARYFWTVSQRDLSHSCDWTFFIRRSTGRLCADPVPGGLYLYSFPRSNGVSNLKGLDFLAGVNP
ncbi:hypothetical protein MSAN_00294700 [Mycena sanguinolenta]|uniref:Uncharacterized protein n=1 Tax=Mycena sanguinolenta TaxID=230812 RepID=A0A8H6ZBD6_9AGAR|nr:hypothetical protein MSAN_00294700 [Mycena sanguinolenta]